jgi:anthranilate phosphoribosyltransferase
MFTDYLKLVGVGKNGSKDLTFEQSVECMNQFLNKEPTVVQRSAFLMAERMKGESLEELKGFLKGLKNHTKTIDLSDYNPVDIAVNYDGKNRSLHILPSAVFIASGVGLNTVSHGSDKVPAKYGTNMNDILNSMGCKNLENEYQIKESMEQSGFVWYHQKYFLPKLYELLPERKEFTLRTFFNVIEKLVNPFNTETIFTGVFHGNYIQKLIPLSEITGFKKVVVSQSLESGIEPFPFPNRKTRIADNEGNQYVVSSEEFGINIHEDEINITDIEQNAKINLEIGHY